MIPENTTSTHDRMTLFRTIIALILLTAVLSVPSVSYSSGVFFDFNNVNEIADWRFVNVDNA